MKKDATQQGVSQEDELKETDEFYDDDQIADDDDDDKLNPYTEGRLKTLNAIGDNANKKRISEGELEDVDEFDEDAPPEKEPVVEPEKKEPVVEDDPEEEIIVDGEKQKVRKSKIFDAGKRALQKESAADKRLQEASQLKAELAQLKIELEAQRGAPQKKAEPPQKDDQQVSTMDQAEALVAEARKKFASATSEMDEDLIFSAQEELGRAQEKVWELKTKQLESGILSKADERAMEREKQKAHEALHRRFALPVDKGGLADLYTDERAKLLWAREVDRLAIDEKADLLDFDTYAKAAQSIRDYLNRGKSADEKQEDKTREDKLEKKRKLDNVRGVNAKPPSNVADDKPVSHEEIVRIGIKEAQRGRIL